VPSKLMSTRAALTISLMPNAGAGCGEAGGRRAGPADARSVRLRQAEQVEDLRRQASMMPMATPSPSRAILMRDGGTRKQQHGC